MPLELPFKVVRTSEQDEVLARATNFRIAHAAYGLAVEQHRTSSGDSHCREVEMNQFCLEILE